MEVMRLLDARHESPLKERAARGFDRPVGIGFRRIGNRIENFFGGRVDHGERLPALDLEEFSVDPKRSHAAPTKMGRVNIT